jgi:VWFA-related protein
MIMERTMKATGLLLLLALCCMAQTKSDDDVVRITTNLVQVDVIVTKSGKPVRDLKVEDFEIFEDGKRQEITSFAFISSSAIARETASKNQNAPSGTATPAEVSPRMIALVIDDLGLSAQSTADVRRQVRKFIDEKLDPTDLVAWQA